MFKQQETEPYYLVGVDHNHMAVHKNDDNTLWNGSEEVRNIRSECEEDEGIDCEDGDSETDW
jgi:hypothetical protein